MNSNQFITDVAVVSSKGKCPQGYSILNFTTMGNDANLHEGSFLKGGERYLCFARIQNSPTIVTDMNIVKEKDPIHTGFTAVKNCINDGSEKTLRKHMLCLKKENIQTARSGVVNVIAVLPSKGEKVPGNHYTISNDLNGINICYQTLPNSNVRQPPPYGHHSTMVYRPPNVHPGQGFAPYPVGGHHMPVPVGLQSAAPPSHNQPPSPGNKHTSAIQGVLFQMNPKFELLWKKSGVSDKTTGNRTLSDIEKKYGSYTFETEKSILSSR